MLQRILAAVMVVAGLVVAGLAVASATVWKDSETVLVTATAADDGTLIVTEPGVLNTVADSVRVVARAEGGVTLAVGREIDVNGWVRGSAVTRVTGLSDWETLATTREAAEPDPVDETEPDADAPADGEEPADPDAEQPATDDAATEQEDAEAAEGEAPPDPTGSDMWVLESSGADSAELTWTAEPDRWMLLVASTGEGAGPPTLELTWHRTVKTPLLWPGVVLGAFLVLGGGVWLVLALRARGGGAPTGVGAVPVEVADTVPDRPSPRDDGAVVGAPAAPRVTEPEAITRVLTRREIREQEEAQRVAGRPKRNWLTGSIPIVPRRAKEDVPAEPDPSASEGRGDAWRRAWGMDKDAAPTSVPPQDAGWDPQASGSSPEAPSAAEGAVPSRRSRRGTHAGPEPMLPAAPGHAPVPAPETSSPYPGPSPYPGDPSAPGPSTEPDGSQVPPSRRRGRRLFTDETDGGQQ